MRFLRLSFSFFPFLWLFVFLGGCFGSLGMLWLVDSCPRGCFGSLEMLWLFASLGIPCLFGPLGMLWLFGSLGGALRLKYIRKGNITTLLQNCDPISGRLVAVLYL